MLPIRFVALAALLLACRSSSTTTSDEVDVVFVKASSGEIIARSKMPVGDLPETFLVETTLEVEGKTWSVVTAEPATKKEFSKTGHLRVALAPIEMVDPSKLLYSLPTISDDLGVAVGNEAPAPDRLQITEDDWRQTEFVSARHAAAVLEELRDIRAVYSEHRKGVGFDAIHVRKRVPEPIVKGSVSLAAVKKLFPPTRTYEGVSFVRQSGTIPGAFAWVADSITLWGVVDPNGNVLVLSVVMPDGDPEPSVTARLTEASESLDLILVDWVTMSTIPVLPGWGDGQSDAAQSSAP